jgi:hypothetical protein
MDNATRRELLYKARAAGYPGSILDVYANYAQGRDLIAEFQQQQQLQQAQQMSDMAAQQVGMQMPQQQMQQPQQQMQPQMPVVPSSPTPAPNFTPPQPPAPIGVQSQDTSVGIVSGQSGPNQGRAIFATGGFTEEDPIKDLYAAYNKKKLEKITDPRTGKLLPTNDPRAQSLLRETFEGNAPADRKTPYTRAEMQREQNKIDVGYPIGAGQNDMFTNYFPNEAKNLGIKGLFEPTHFVDFNGKATKNPNYWKGNLTEDGKEWLELTKSKFGIDPAVLGYYSDTEGKTMADYAPELLVESEKYSKQPIISVGKFGNQLTWAPRKGDIMTKKNVADEEGQLRVVGATNMSGVDIPKKKKATGGFSGEGPGCPDGYFKDKEGNCVPLMQPSDSRGEEYYADSKNEGWNFPKSPGCFNYDCGEVGYKEYPRYAANNITYYGKVLSRGKEGLDYSGSDTAAASDEKLINQYLDQTDTKAKQIPYPGVQGAFTTVTTETAEERAQRAKTVDVAKIREDSRRHHQNSFAENVTNFAKFNRYGEQKPLTFEEFNNLTKGYAHEYLFESDASAENKKAVAATIEPKSYEAYIANALAFKPQKEQLLKKNVADEEGGLRVFGENVTGKSEITIKKEKPYSKLSEEERAKADEEEEYRKMERDNYYREAKTKYRKKQQDLQENKKLGGVKCYTCVGRKRRV